MKHQKLRAVDDAIKEFVNKDYAKTNTKVKKMGTELAADAAADGSISATYRTLTINKVTLHLWNISQQLFQES